MTIISSVIAPSFINLLDRTGLTSPVVALLMLMTGANEQGLRVLLQLQLLRCCLYFCYNYCCCCCYCCYCCCRWLQRVFYLTAAVASARIYHNTIETNTAISPAPASALLRLTLSDSRCHSCAKKFSGSSVCQINDRPRKPKLFFEEMIVMAAAAAATVDVCFCQIVPIRRRHSHTHKYETKQTLLHLCSSTHKHGCTSYRWFHTASVVWS